jgi:hypothetical protein
MNRRQISWWAAAAILAASPALAAPASVPVPGTLNFVEGQATINGQPVDSKSIGSEVVRPGTVLSTGNGKVEMLLTPGVFLRLGENSQLRMVSAGLADTEVALVAGQASIEADYYSKDNRLIVDAGMASTTILKQGLYVLNANQPLLQVLDGKATVTLGSQHVNAGKDRDVIVNPAGKLKAQDFNGQAAQNEALVRWSRLRSEYEAQANYETAQTLAVGNGYYGPGYGYSYGYGPAWYGPGWYWDAGFGFWSFLPGDGFLYSPFGWGFYSPAFLYGYGYHPGFYGRPGFAAGGGLRGGFVGGGFHGGGGGRR